MMKVLDMCRGHSSYYLSNKLTRVIEFIVENIITIILLGLENQLIYLVEIPGHFFTLSLLVLKSQVLV